jgi:hypothetical protein
MTTSARPLKLTPRPLAGGDGWYVQVDWADFSEQVGAFVSRAEAEEWIANKLSEWLRRYERPPNPGGHYSGQGTAARVPARLALSGTTVRRSA